MGSHELRAFLIDAVVEMGSLVASGDGHRAIGVATEFRTRYDVVISPHGFEGLANALTGIALGPNALVLTDPTVGKRHTEELGRELEAGGFKLAWLPLPGGALAVKRLATLKRVYEAMYDHRVDRRSVLIAFGGGGIGDIGCFAAGTYMRGVPLVQVPTTLLSQVDSAIGGKGAVHYAGLANLIGTYHQPRAVWCNLELTDSLPPREFGSGLAEILKSMLVGDAEGFRLLQVLDRRSVGSALANLVARAISVKGRLVSLDEREIGPRLLLNYGHTIGHAIEEASHFRYAHGEAVAIGMVGACFVGEQLGISSPDLTRSHECAIKALGLPSRPSRAMFPRGSDSSSVTSLLLQLTHRDKKAEGAGVRFVVLRDVAVGEVVHDVPDRIISIALDRLFSDWR